MALDPSFFRLTRPGRQGRTFRRPVEQALATPRCSFRWLSRGDCRQQAFHARDERLRAAGRAISAGRERTMSVYMIQASYTSQAWAAMANRPEHREQIFRSLCEQAGAKFVGSYYCFGEYDVIAFYDAPNAITAAAVPVAVEAAGHLKS